MTDATPDPHEHPEQLQPLAGVLALLLPGAGHVYLGQTARGLWIGAGVLGLFFTGLLVGGITSVDSALAYHQKIATLLGRPAPDRATDGEPVWYLGQAFVGPIAWGVDYAHQFAFKVRDPRTRLLRDPWPNESRNPDASPAPLAPGQSPPLTKGLGRVAELGMLLCTIAGMLNLLCVIDAGWHAPRRRGDAA